MTDLKKLSEYLDSKYKILGVRIGWDGILGLIPGVGDLVTSILSLYIVARAASLGCSTPVLLRMGLNVLIDNLIAAVPLLGNIGDFFWRSNNKNLRLLQRHVEDPRATSRASLGVILSVVALVLGMSLILIALGVYGLIRLIQIL